MSTQTDIELKLLQAISEDKRFADDTISKLEHYAAKFPKIVEYHPMGLIYACAKTDDVNECVQLVSNLSKFFNHSRQSPDEADILSLVSQVSSSKASNLSAIYEAEKTSLPVILGMPLIFFKACNERSEFNIDHLKMMLRYKNQVQNDELSQHDASVGVGTILVDKSVAEKRKCDKFIHERIVHGSATSSPRTSSSRTVNTSLTHLPSPPHRTPKTGHRRPPSAREHLRRAR